MENNKELRCGFVAFVGAANAGKSTLLNAMVGTKVSITSHKVQTTRTRVRGILNIDQSQIIFVDTPGIFASQKKFEQILSTEAWAGAFEADQIVLIVDAAKGPCDVVKGIIEKLKHENRKAILVLNKIDLLDKEKLLPLIAKFDSYEIFSHTFLVSALKEKHIDDLKNHLASNLPVSEWLYPEDQLTTMSDRIFAAEVTREKLFLELHEEIPYSLFVETQTWKELPDGAVRIDQIIFVERAQQRAIIIGKGGQKLKRIGQQSRIELEQLYARRVHLFLHVKVREKWKEHFDPNQVI